MRSTDGRRPFGPAALVAISPCGDWWVYPWGMRLTRVHELLRFHGIRPCKLCITRCDEVPADAHPPGGRDN